MTSPDPVKAPDRHRYVLGLGSNRMHGRHGRPDAVLRAAIARIEAGGAIVVARSRLRITAPLGPSHRRFANMAVLVEGAPPPLAMLALVKAIEAAFGRRNGRRWGARVLDIDLLLWGGGTFRSRRLTIPHAQLCRRGFALLPAAEVAGGWRLPRDGRALGAVAARFRRPKPLDPRAPRP